MTAPAEPAADRRRRFVDYLNTLARQENRAALASLRRALGQEPGAAHEAHKYIQPFLGDETRGWEEEIYYLVGALFATHPRDWTPALEERAASSLGASFRRLRDKTSSDDAIERRFVALLSAHVEDVGDHLRHAIGLLSQHEVPVDYAQLLRDLRAWRSEERWVQRKWARHYWRAEGRNTETESAEQTTGEEAE